MQEGERLESLNKHKADMLLWKKVFKNRAKLLEYWTHPVGLSLPLIGILKRIVESKASFTTDKIINVPFYSILCHVRLNGR